MCYWLSAKYRDCLNCGFTSRWWRRATWCARTRTASSSWTTARASTGCTSGRCSCASRESSARKSCSSLRSNRFRAQVRTVNTLYNGSVSASHSNIYAYMYVPVDYRSLIVPVFRTCRLGHASRNVSFYQAQVVRRSEGALQVAIIFRRYRTQNTGTKYT